MIPVIDKKETGINIRLTMDRLDMSVRDLQQHLGLSSLQSIYHWLNGICLPTVDNLYALSDLFNTTIDDLICGSRISAHAQVPSGTGNSIPSAAHRFYGVWWQQIPLSALGLHRAGVYKKIS
jgi:transcriptional regulator with XRE-family HTH domain